MGKKTLVGTFGNIVSILLIFVIEPSKEFDQCRPKTGDWR